MRVITPITIATGGALTATNVGTSLDPAAYNAGTNYALDQQCVVGETIYQSAVAGNIGNDPPTSPDKWGAVSAINKLKMFDRAVSTQTVNPNTIDVTVTPGRAVGVVSLLNLDGAAVTVEQTDPVEGLVFTTGAISLTEDVASWSEYLYTPVVRKRSLLVPVLPTYRNASIRVLIDNTGGDAKCGVCIVGESVNPGAAEYGASDGIDDYSIVAPDRYGIRDIVERDYADDAEMTIWVPAAQSERFRRILAERRAKPTLFVLADHRPDAQYYGLPSFRRTFRIRNHDIFALTVKGFT